MGSEDASAPRLDPRTGAALPPVEFHSTEEVERRIERAHRVWREGWAALTPEARAPVLRRVAELLRASIDAFARRMSEEMGKPLAQGRAEVEKCAWVCDYYADEGPAFLADESLPGELGRSYVAYRPLGLVLAIMPWNFPLWQVFRCAAPALMAGNGVLLKHATNVPGCAREIEAIFAEAGLPAGLFARLDLPDPAVKAVIEDPRVAAVSLTGSTRAGRAVASAAGAALKPCVLELGGSDPYVVLGDADVESAARICVAGRMVNGGQSCIAAKRLVVVEPLREAFTAAVVRAMAAYLPGDPLDPQTTLGPMARIDLRDALHRQVRESVSAGARLALGGTLPARPGAWYPATVLTGVGPGMPAYHEELFGPVAAIVPARDEEEALRIANDSAFGLGACVFTGDLRRGERIARDELRAGACFVNAHVRSDPRQPFGGIKDSGYGRELGRPGLLAFVNAKTVCISGG